MKEFILSKRYALALLKAAREGGRIAEINDGLQKFFLLCTGKRIFFHWLTCEEIDKKRRGDALEDVAKVMRLPDVLCNFLLILVRSERIRHLPQIARIFSGLADEAMDIIRGTLYAADKIGATEAAKGISSFLRNKTKKDVRIEAHERPQLIAGAVLQIKNVLWDASVKRRLQDMEERLCQ